MESVGECKVQLFGAFWDQEFKGTFMGPEIDWGQKCFSSYADVHLM